MTHKNTLVGTSLLSVLLLSFHLAQDAIHAKAGTIESGAGNVTAILILVVLLSGPALLADRRSGRIIMLFVAFFAVGMPALHFNIGHTWNKHQAALVFVWCLIANAVSAHEERRAHRRYPVHPSRRHCPDSPHLRPEYDTRERQRAGDDGEHRKP
ncbi:MAG: hypothetical protein ABIT20_19745 [Gemmatimonadaceae bacterium]